jgi:CDP-diglyceride synthetase
MIQRILTVLMAVPILLGALFSPWPVLFKLLVLLAILVGMAEFANLSQFSREEKIMSVVLGGFHAVILMSGLLNSDRLLLEISLVLMVVFFSYLITHRDLPGIGQ